MNYYQNALKLKARMSENQAIVDTVNEAGGIRKTEPVQSDKLGYDLVHYYVNDILVRSVYVEQENPSGTAKNPIVWEPEMKLIQNAYYVHNGVRKVWMGQGSITATWDDEGWEVF